MSGYQTNEVATHSALGCFSVRQRHPCLARQLKAAVGEKLGLKYSSLQLFGLFEGPLGSPCRYELRLCSYTCSYSCSQGIIITRSVLVDESTVPPDAKLCFQRWTLDLDKEARLSRQDDTALHLLFAEAKFNVDQGNIAPSAEQSAALESLLDPAFPAERQYLELARSLPGYGTYVARGVAVDGDITSNEVHIPSGAVVVCLVGSEGLTLRTREVYRALSDRDLKSVRNIL